LMRVLSFDEGKVDVIHGIDAGNGETIYPTPASEFELSRIQCSKDRVYHSGTRAGPDILIVMEGEITATADVDKLQFKKGESFFASQDCSYEITSQSGFAVVFKASIPSSR
jgi:mannose-6-phosphate isomerase